MIENKISELLVKKINRALSPLHFFAGESPQWSLHPLRLISFRPFPRYRGTETLPVLMGQHNKKTSAGTIVSALSVKKGGYLLSRIAVQYHRRARA